MNSRQKEPMTMKERIKIHKDMEELNRKRLKEWKEEMEREKKGA